MNIDKAIKILTLFDRGQYPGSAENFRASVKLGNEALQRVKSTRKLTAFVRPGLLPSETPGANHEN